jgi:hypothetical protein
MLLPVIPSEVEEWSEPGVRDIDGKAERPRERERASQSLDIMPDTAARPEARATAARPLLHRDLQAQAPFA